MRMKHHSVRPFNLRMTSFVSQATDGFLDYGRSLHPLRVLIRHSYRAHGRLFTELSSLANLMSFKDFDVIGY